MLFCWDGVYVCMDCFYRLNDTEDAKAANADRILNEDTYCNSIGDVFPEDFASRTEEEQTDYIGERSASRGVSIGFLLQFTQRFDCWSWSSAEIIRKIIKPATQGTRCRFVELPEMKEFTGPAKTFISYAQAGCWGDLVAAVLDG